MLALVSSATTGFWGSFRASSPSGAVGRDRAGVLDHLLDTILERPLGRQQTGQGQAGVFTVDVRAVVVDETAQPDELLLVAGRFFQRGPRPGQRCKDSGQLVASRHTLSFLLL